MNKQFSIVVFVLFLLAAGTAVASKPPASNIPPDTLRPLYVPQPPTDAFTQCGIEQEIQHIEYWPVEGDGLFVAQFLASGGGTVTFDVEGQSTTVEIANTPNLQPYTVSVRQTTFPGYRPATIYLEANTHDCPSGGQRVTAINVHVGS